MVRIASLAIPHQKKDAAVVRYFHCLSVSRYARMDPEMSRKHYSSYSRIIMHSPKVKPSHPVSKTCQLILWSCHDPVQATHPIANWPLEAPFGSSRPSPCCLPCQKDLISSPRPSSDQSFPPLKSDEEPPARSPWTSSLKCGATKRSTGQ